jgi:hypothetical protein
MTSPRGRSPTKNDIAALGVLYSVVAGSTLSSPTHFRQVKVVGIDASPSKNDFVPHRNGAPKVGVQRGCRLGRWEIIRVGVRPLQSLQVQQPDLVDKVTRPEFSTSTRYSSSVKMLLIWMPDFEEGRNRAQKIDLYLERRRKQLMRNGLAEH